MISWAGLLIVAFDVFAGLRLQFEFKDIGIAAFITIGATLIRMTGLWFMLVTGAFD
jgi:hypothetical protein